ncbi:MAG TPA: universal stress protein [Tahibacter sp.]|nr:universal stress protein [Tahibacter sp.]
MKILLAVDGSTHSRLAIKYITKHWRLFGSGAALTLLHVDPPLMSRVAQALGREEVVRYHADNAKAALRHARMALRRARIEPTELCLVGDPGATIARTASTARSDLIVMGSHGHGAFGNLLLGSVVTKVLHGCKVPVLIVR